MKFIDLFAGIGGFRRGMELAGHECIGFCEFDKYATASYTSMHLITDEQREKLIKLDLRKRQKEILKDEYRNGEWYAKDIREVTGDTIPRADCWCGGFPCQDISVAGKQLGFDGERSSLFFEIIRLLQEQKEEDRPEWLLLENVKNLLSINSGWVFARVLIALEEVGYDCQWQVFNSADWGVPQHRERVYIIGHLRKYGERKIFPITGADGENSVCGVNEEIINEKAGEKNNNKINIIGHRDGYRRNLQTFSPDGITEALDTCGGGGRGHYVAVKCIGNCNPSGNGMNGNIFDSSGLNPTLTTNKGEGNKIGIKISPEDISSDGGFNQKGTVHSINGVSRTVIGSGHSGNEPKVCIPIGCIDPQGRLNKEVEPSETAPTLRAESHGNNPEVVLPVLTPDRINKRQNGRRFKENGEPAFTLTAQDKHGVAIGIDNLYKNRPIRFYEEEIPALRSERNGLKVGIEVNPEVIGGVGEKNFGKQWRQGNRIYDGEKVATALESNPVGNTGGQSNLYSIPLGVLRNVRSEYGKEIRKQYENGELDISRHEFLEKEIKEDGTSNTIDSVQKDNYLAIKVAEGEEEKEHPGIYVELYPGCTVYAVWYKKYECYIAVRKLTPKECFRLQGWTDDYFEKAKFVNSNSQLYKQSGNGVTVNVIYEIAKRLN